MSRVIQPNEDFAGQMLAVEQFIAAKTKPGKTALDIEKNNRTAPAAAIEEKPFPQSIPTEKLKLWESRHGFDLSRQNKSDLAAKQKNSYLIAWQPAAAPKDSSEKPQTPKALPEPKEKMPVTAEQEKVLREFEKGEKTSTDVMKAFGGNTDAASKYLQENFAPKDSNFTNLVKAMYDAKLTEVEVENKKTEKQKRETDEFLNNRLSNVSNFKALQEFANKPDLTDGARQYIEQKRAEFKEAAKFDALREFAPLPGGEAARRSFDLAATFEMSPAERDLLIDELAARMEENYPKDANLLQSEAARRRLNDEEGKSFDPAKFVELSLKHSEELIQKGYPRAAAHFLDSIAKTAQDRLVNHKDGDAAHTLLNFLKITSKAQSFALKANNSKDGFDAADTLDLGARTAEKIAEKLAKRGDKKEAEALQNIAARAYLEAERNRDGAKNLEILEALGLANKPADVANLSTVDKFKSAIEKSFKYLGPDTVEKIKELFSPESIAMMAGMAGLWAAGHLFGVSEIADVLLLGVGAVMLGKEAFDIGQHLGNFVLDSYNAKSEADLDKAGHEFSQAVSKAGVDVIAAILTHKATKSIAPQVKAGLQQTRGRMIGLNEAEQGILNKLTNPQAKGRITIPEEINPQTLARLTNAAQSEIAVLRNPKTGETKLIMGDRKIIPLTVEEAKTLGEQGWKFEAHSHWRDTNPSIGDARVLGEGFNQRRSLIVDRKGRMAEFTPEQGRGGAADRLSQGAPEPKPVNLTSLGRGRWLGKEVNVGDKLPDGYEWNGNQIHRKNGYAAQNYAKLCVDENGRIAVAKGDERISNPYWMKKNHENALAKQYESEGLSPAKARAKAQKRIAEIESHHLMPDEAIQKTELGQEARRRGYDLDRGENLLDMPNAPKRGRKELGHWTSHPKYTDFVMNKMKDAAADLKNRYGDLKNVPDQVLQKKMSELENFFRTEIEKVKNGEKSTVPHDGKRLIFNFENAYWKRVMA